MDSRPGTSSNNKRQRSENWLDEDKIVLKELVRERVSVIENKNTDANTNSKKVAAWHDLRISFNSMAKTPRTLQQLKAQWGFIKMSAKKTKFRERKERIQTGGGPPPSSEPASGEDIAVWLPHEFIIDTNEFDSDNQNFQEIKEKTQKPVSPIPCQSSGHETIEMMLEPSQSQEAEPSVLLTQPEDTETTTTTTKPKIQNFRLKTKKVSRTSKEDAVLLIAETETACRKALHEAQMANENQKLKNLILKEQVLKAKLEYYKNKLI